MPLPVRRDILRLLGGLTSLGRRHHHLRAVDSEARRGMNLENLRRLICRVPEGAVIVRDEHPDRRAASRRASHPTRRSTVPEFLGVRGNLPRAQAWRRAGTRDWVFTGLEKPSGESVRDPNRTPRAARKGKGNPGRFGPPKAHGRSPPVILQTVLSHQERGFAREPFGLYRMVTHGRRNDAGRWPVGRCDVLRIDASDGHAVRRAGRGGSPGHRSGG